MVENVACFSLLFLGFLFVGLLKYVVDFWVSVGFVLEIFRLVNFEMNGCTLLHFFIVELVVPFLASLIVPGLYYVPAVVPLALVIEGVFVLALGLEVGVIDIVVGALIVVSNFLVGKVILQLPNQVVEVLDAQLSLPVEQLVGLVRLASAHQVEGPPIVLLGQRCLRALQERVEQKLLASLIYQVALVVNPLMAHLPEVVVRLQHELASHPHLVHDHQNGRHVVLDHVADLLLVYLLNLIVATDVCQDLPENMKSPLVILLKILDLCVQKLSVYFKRQHRGRGIKKLLLISAKFTHVHLN